MAKLGPRCCRAEQHIRGWSATSLARGGRQFRGEIGDEPITSRQCCLPQCSLGLLIREGVHVDSPTKRLLQEKCIWPQACRERPQDSGELDAAQGECLCDGYSLLEVDVPDLLQRLRECQPLSRTQCEQFVHQDRQSGVLVPTGTMSDFRRRELGFCKRPIHAALGARHSLRICGQAGRDPAWRIPSAGCSL